MQNSTTIKKKDTHFHEIIVKCVESNCYKKTISVLIKMISIIQNYNKDIKQINHFMKNSIWKSEHIYISYR